MLTTCMACDTGRIARRCELARSIQRTSRSALPEQHVHKTLQYGRARSDCRVYVYVTRGGPVGPASGRRGRRGLSTAMRRVDENSSNSDMAIDETRRIHSGGLSANQYIPNLTTLRVWTTKRAITENRGRTLLRKCSTRAHRGRGQPRPTQPDRACSLFNLQERVQDKTRRASAASQQPASRDSRGQAKRCAEFEPRCAVGLRLPGVLAWAFAWSQTDAASPFCRPCWRHARGRRAAAHPEAATSASRPAGWAARRIEGTGRRGGRGGLRHEP